MKHTTSTHNPTIGAAFLLLHAQCKVLLQFACQAVADVTARAELAFLAEERRIVDGEKHRHGWFVDTDGWKCLWLLEVTNRVTYLEIGQTNHGTNISAAHFCRGTVSHTLERVQFLNLGLFLTTITMANRHVHTALERATMHTSHSDTSRVGTIIERCDQHLSRSIQLLWSRNRFQNHIHQVVDVVSRFVPILAHPTLLSRAIHHREVQLVLRCIEVEHQVEHHFIDLFRAAVWLIDLVHYDHRLQSNLECLLQHKTSLRHRTLKGIHQQDTTVCHVEHALHLATEVAVSWSVNHVDFHSFIINTNVLGKNCYTTLALELIVIQNQISCLLVLSEQMTSHQHLIDQGGFSVVNVCNNCNVSNLLHFLP